jgi:hypothetical protein
MTDCDPGDEYPARRPLLPEILAALTTAPAGFAGDARARTATVGRPGDLVLLEDDPETDILALGRVRSAIGADRAIYERAP